MERGEISDKSYDCQRDLIRLDWNGYFIIVENDGVAGDHVDVLVRFSKSKQQQEAMSFLKERILETFRTFCASPEGCRGVTLVTAIIRPECVQKLTAREYREDQVILEKELKKRLREDMEKKLHQKEITWPAGNKRGESILNYEHTWPQTVEAKLRKCCQRAVELLEEKDVSEILDALQERRVANRQRVCEVLEQLDDHLQDTGKEDIKGLNLNRLKIDSELIHLDDGDGRLPKAMERRFDKIDNNIQRVHHQLQEVFVALSQQLQKIFDLQTATRAALLSVISKIDMMVGYSEAQEAARLPRRPFISFNDVGLREKISGVVQIGTPVRLHLMCESRLEPHIVEDQPGLKLIIGDQNKELLRWILVNSTKVFWFLLKAGVQVTLGAGSVIPELAHHSLGSKAGLVLADMTLEELKTLGSLPVMEESQMAEEMWMFLKNQLPPEKKISSTFKLYLVKYNPGMVAVEESYAWLCEKCIEKGKKNNVLKVLL
ncbi:hypothetical protein R1flu_029218 [Riccia fluitans]|uniref:Uncharacterized protein n=1 Tax=Riccia fluitans TaxID=41844 RepID=A0ABD1XPH2_9MARC